MHVVQPSVVVQCAVGAMVQQLWCGAVVMVQLQVSDHRPAEPLQGPT